MATYNNNIQAAIRKVKAPIPIATITSQIEASCGDFDVEVSNPNDLMPNIDGDIDNQLVVAEYVEDICKSYRKNERMDRVQNYMTSQSEINEKMRAILVDWYICSFS